MARKRGKMALYEVMSKARAKSNYDKTVEPLMPPKKPEKNPIMEEPAAPEPQIAVNWRKKPRIIQFNLGRIEFSIPYQLAITVGLALLLLFLIAFKFGQYSNRKPAPANTGNNPGNNSRVAGPTGLANPEVRRPAVSNTDTSAPVINRDAAPVTPAAPAGKNVIRLAQHAVKSQLEPAREYFNKNNIPTEIVTDGSIYFLQTVERFVDNPANTGTKGNELIQKIGEIGKKYIAPQGYEPFAPNFFKDAYGKKIEN